MLEYEDIACIPTEECAEKLVTINGSHPNIECQPINEDMLKYCRNQMLARAGVAERLIQVARRLENESPEVKLIVVYAYRHPELQRRYFEAKQNQIRTRSPSLSPQELRRMTHRLIASPDVAGHPTGGAVDVTLCRNGKYLPTGGDIWDLSDTDRIQTFSSKATPEERINRLRLRDLMVSGGFAPFDGEWWHFSYGDKEWAAYFKMPNAMYSEIGLPGLT